VNHKTSQQVYVATVGVVGLAVVAQSLWEVTVYPPGIEWFVLAALTLLTGSFTVKVPSVPAIISVSETFIFTSVLLFGPAAGTTTVVLDALVISFWMNRGRWPLSKVIFNTTAPAIAIRLSSELFFLASAARPGQIHRGDVGALIIPVFSFALLYFVVNSALVAGALTLQRGESAIRLWLRNFPWVSINYFVGSSIAMLIVAYTDQIDLTVLGIILPLLLISYLTFRTSMGRLDDAHRHVAQLNELYLSTIETLAMAVDAKDQITHGHIRRVQVYATELAKRLGVSDESQLKAIETAALLHDMGKLAIPEHILNKPGRLTAAEFQRMKQHADLGADLLSSIRFPYPVVPIVRHHHECWDGTGYPSGIARTDIPLGARILAVVDCFDALTSDRPYRPRLSTHDAFAILNERRGTSYDPIVVDTFSKAFAEIAPLAIRAGEEARSMLIPIGATVPPDSHALGSLKQIRANASETALLAECRDAVSRSTTLSGAFDAAIQCLRQLTPATVFALYRHHPETDSLICELASGDQGGRLEGLSIKVGQRITGWAAATRTTSINSDASLDLAQIAECFHPPLRSSLSSAMAHDERLAGVLTAYTTKDSAFSDAHGYALEQVAAALAQQLRKFADASSKSTVSHFPTKSHR
jgi:putative nucleotidyltransferase with HDIG domain